MKTKHLLFVLIGMFISINITLQASQKNEKIVMMTENYPPFSMQNNENVEGIAVDILEAILKKIDSPQTKQDVQLTNWSRAYSYAQKKENYMVFSTARTPNREELFKWVGPFAKVRFALIAPKSKNIKIDSLNDIKKYKVGTVLQDIAEQLLLEKGIEKENLSPVSGKNAIKLSFKKLENNRIDIFAYEFFVARYSGKLEGFNVDDYEVVYTLQESDIYYAFNKNTDDSIINKWQKALEEIKADGTYDNILKKY